MRNARSDTFVFAFERTVAKADRLLGCRALRNPALLAAVSVQMAGESGDARRPLDLKPVHQAMDSTGRDEDCSFLF